MRGEGIFCQSKCCPFVSRFLRSGLLVVFVDESIPLRPVAISSYLQRMLQILLFRDGGLPLLSMNPSSINNFSKSKTMNALKILSTSTAATLLALSVGFAYAQSSTGNVNEAGAKTAPGSGASSSSNAADAPKPAGSAKTSNTTRAESTAAGKGSKNTNEAGSSANNAANKPKAASRTKLINRDANGNFIPRARSNGSSSVKENNEAGAKSTSGSQSQNNPGNTPK
jgi:hypothetical protein